MKYYKLKYNLYRNIDGFTIKNTNKTHKTPLVWHGTLFTYNSYNRKLVRLTTVNLGRQISLDFTIDQIEKWFEEHGN